MATLHLNETQRWVQLEGASNFRDVGGLITRNATHRVKWGKIYRAGELSALKPEGWNELVRRGVKHICDLRRADEYTLYPIKPPQNSGIQLHTWEFSSGALEDMSQMAAGIRAALRPLNQMDDETLRKWVISRHVHYEDTASMLKKHIRGVFDIVLEVCREDKGGSVIVCCGAGKDRTGFVIAFLLEALDVARNEILDDYELTSAAYLRSPPDMNWLKPLFEANGLDELSSRVILAMSLAHRPAMAQALEALSAPYHWSIREYLGKEFALSDEEVAVLRKALLEPNTEKSI